MIPKIIHYCWFGHNPLPKSAKDCIASWKKYLPDYEIKEWNEDNFDVNIIPYTKDAYAAKKYAFVSDYARFWVLYHYGGLYFDTDVEVIKPIDDLINKGAFMGWETSGEKASINPGLGLCVEKGNSIYKEILDIYHSTMKFYAEDGTRNSYTMIPMVSELMEKYGLKRDGSLQTIKDITIYPIDFFNPYNYLIGELNKTKNTRTIHWYSMSWYSWRQKARLFLSMHLRKFIHKLKK